MEADLFDVAVDNEIGNHKRQKTGTAKERDEFNAPNKKRQYKNEKFGFGGKKRFSKSGDAISSGNVSSINGRKAGRGRVSKTKALRPGKRRRKAESSRG
jgi:rRNA-processing protein EBP2